MNDARTTPANSAPGNDLQVSRRDSMSAGLLMLAGGMLMTSADAVAAEPAAGPAENPLVVDVPGIVVPIASGTSLVNYLFTGIRVLAADTQSAAQVRSTQFLARDLIVRASGRNPVPAGRERASYDAVAAAAMMKTAIETGFRGVRLTSLQLRDPRLMRP
jgi:hypothetical protein